MQGPIPSKSKIWGRHPHLVGWCVRHRTVTITDRLSLVAFVTIDKTFALLPSFFGFFSLIRLDTPRPWHRHPSFALAASGPNACTHSLSQHFDSP